MLNLIKMESYRTRKSVSAYVTLFMTIVILAMSIFITNYWRKNYETTVQEMVERQEKAAAGEEEDVEGIKVNLNPPATPVVADENGDYNFNDMLNMALSSEFIIAVGIFFALFFSAPFKDGYVKNFLGQCKKKEDFVLASFINAAIFTLILQILFLVGSLIALPICFNGHLTKLNAAEVFETVGSDYIMNMAFIAIILAVAVISRSSGVTTAFTVAYAVGILKPVIALLNMLVEKAGGNFNFSDYSLHFLMSGSLLGEFKTSHVVAVSAVYIILFTVISSLVIRKRDAI